MLEEMHDPVLSQPIFVKAMPSQVRVTSFPVPQITERLRGLRIKYEENFERSIGTFFATHIFAYD